MAEKDKDPNANPLTPTTTHEGVVSKETPTLYAEEVHYGYSGAKGMLKSPYVFGPRKPSCRVGRHATTIIALRRLDTLRKQRQRHDNR